MLGVWHAGKARGLAKRVIACLDVRANDAGDLVVTKGDQYDVRETDGQGGEVLFFSRALTPFWTASELQNLDFVTHGGRCLH